MDRLHLMTVFVAVAEEESFVGGARRLGMSPPAVTRAIAALEDRLRLKLLDRSTRHVRVTEAGQRYLDDARRIIAEVDEADEAAAGINAAPRGHLSVTAPVLFGRMYVMPGIVEYLQRYPDTEVSTVFVDRVTNLLEEGLDVGVRIGELPDSSLRAIAVGHVRRVICVAPAYLERHGLPRTPEELARHTIISATGSSAAPEWRFLRDGTAQSLRLKSRLTVNSNDAAIEAARLGLGVIRLLSYQAAPALEKGDLQRVLAEYEMPPLPIHIVHRDSRHGSARIRAFIDLMAARLRAEPALNCASQA
ncbi:LysR family transcriptional regulator [Pseudoduganella violacea]|uniref:DNA-binding transcriptional LysR family regulator n=1 Tax=Pseudoduganella violacea TaxID=1715466 RepID=A0A7W5BC73_9BURK|nr:LysR family transcriptional regulator [Pseudoduganella violacea]MBB3120436.1 DNA-binding transcriptional LysR family regulator [Pseudoduganella violacea]